MLETFYTAQEVAKMMSVSTRTLRNWTNSGAFPKPVELSPQTRRWPESVIAQHMELKSAV